MRVVSQRNAIIITFFIIGLVGIAWGIFQYIDYAMVRTNEAASLAYSGLLEKMQASDDDKTAKTAVAQKAEQFIHQYPKTVYADMTRLMLAGIAVEESHAVAAKTYLKAVQDKHGPLAHIARLRLARVLASEQQYTEALSTLDKVKSGEFFSLYQSAKGDIYVAMKELTKANEAYQKALQALPNGALDPWLQAKQADIGGGAG